MADASVPETRYARTPDGIHIAYQSLGDGPVDVLRLPSEILVSQTVKGLVAGSDLSFEERGET